jgi:SAM-dependent methyltransferase
VDESARDYEAVAYPSNAITLSSPDRLRAAGLLHGWRGPDAETASVLEIGCANANNLIAIAAAAPRTRCVGFDLSPSAIAAGQAQAASMEIANIELAEGDILTWPRDGERFDYVICHGVFSWIPQYVRQPLLELIASSLAPGGVAYMSYEALPAAAAKLAANRFVREHSASIGDARERIQRGAELTALLARTQSSGSYSKPAFDTLTQEFPKFDPAYFLHDWLEEHYAPIALGELFAVAGKAGLAYAGDARMIDFYLDGLDDDALALLDAHRDDAAKRHEILDLMRGDRIFHEDIFVRADAPPPAESDPWSILTFAFIGERKEASDGGAVEYTVGKSTSFRAAIDSPTARILDVLHAMSPNEATASEIAARSGVKIGIVQGLLSMLCVGIVDAHASPENFAAKPGPVPRASRFIRGTVRSSRTTTTLRHAPLELDDDFVRLLLMHCDGTCSRNAIAAALSQALKTDVPLAYVDHAIQRLAARPLFEA